MTGEEPPKQLPWETPEHLAWVAAEEARMAAEAAAEAEEAKRRRFIIQRQRQLAAERESRRQALARGELVIEPPSAGDPPATVAVVVTRLEPMPGVSRRVHEARNEAYRILLDGALAMSRSGLRLEGRPAGDVGPLELTTAAPVAPGRPRKATPKPKHPKPPRKPQKAAELVVSPRRKPKIRPAPKPRLERPAPPDEVRCAALTSKGERCRFEAVADSRCLVHGSAG